MLINKETFDSDVEITWLPVLGIGLQYTSMLQILFEKTSNICYNFSGGFFMQGPKNCRLQSLVIWIKEKCEM